MKLRTILIMLALMIVLGAVYLFVRSKPAPSPAKEVQTFIWNFEMQDLQMISIGLPKQEMSEAWTKHEDQYFYFDEADGPQVDRARWGGGIPLLLSGPAAARLIAGQATSEQLEVFGLDDPNMRIDLTLKNGRTFRIVLGDSTPDRQGYYIKRTDSEDVYTVDYTWYHVFERLVLDPPYPKPKGG